MERGEESIGSLLRGSSLGLYKTSEQAYQDDVTPRARGIAPPPGEEETIGGLLRGGSAKPYSPSPAPAPSSSNFGRGWDVSGKQLKQTAYGTAALLGDTFGSDSLKKWGLQGYKDAEKEIQAISKESDSFTSAVQSGDIGSWLTYSAGYLAGQFADLAVASGAGALVGGALAGPAAPAGAAAGAVTGAINKAAVQTGLRGAVSKMIDKQAASLTATYIERGMVKEAAERAAAEAAVKSVYRTIGATTANTFLNATGELGSIYGEAVEQAAKTGEEYSLGKVWLSGIAATAVDTWADSKAVKGLTDAFKGKNRVSSIAMEAFKGGMREGLTEGAQTVIERWGADKDLTSKEAFKEYIDSAAVGVLGGTAAGGASGAVSKLQGSPGKPEVDQTQANFTKLPESQSGRTRPLDEDDTPRMIDEEFNATAKNGGFMAALYQQADERGQKRILMAVEQAGAETGFKKALGPQGEAMLEYGRGAIAAEPEFVQRFLGEVNARFGALDPKELLETYPEVAAYLYTQGSKEERQLVRQAVERAGVIDAFKDALTDPAALEKGSKRLQSMPADPMPALTKFATTQSPAGVFKVDRRGQDIKASPTEQDEFDIRAEQEGFTLKEPPAPRTPREQVASMGIGSLPPGFESSTKPDKYGILSHHEPFTMEKDRHQFLYSHKALPGLFFPSQDAVFNALRIRKQAKAEGTWDPAATKRAESDEQQFDQTAAAEGYTLKERPASQKPVANETNKTAATLNETNETDRAGDISSDPMYPEFVRLSELTSAAEKQSDPKDWTPEQRKAYDDGDWKTFSRLRGYTDEEIKDYGAYLDVANKLIAKYGVDAVASEEAGLDDVGPNPSPDVEQSEAPAAEEGAPALPGSDEALYSKSSGGSVKAVFIPSIRTVFYSAGVRNLTPRQRLALRLHEIGAHYGIERMVGEKRYKEILGELESLRGKDAAVDRAFAAVPKDTDPSLVSTEALGYLVEQNANLGLVRRLLQAIKDWYAKTFDGQTLTSSELSRMAKSALDQYGHEVREVQVKEAIKSKPSKDLVKVDFQKALESNPQAHEFLDFISQFGEKLVLTGSLAISPQADVYRPPQEQIHDLDFKVNNQQDVPQIIRAIIQRFPNSALSKTFSSRKGRSWTVQFVVDQNADRPLHIDFFSRTEETGGFDLREPVKHSYVGADGVRREIFLADYRDVFDAKFAFERTKDVNDALFSKKFDSMFSKEEDLPSALTSVMRVLLKNGKITFKEASSQLLERMRANQDWAPLADKVTQGMLLKAWNAAGGEVVDRSKIAPAPPPPKNPVKFSKAGTAMNATGVANVKPSDRIDDETATQGKLNLPVPGTVKRVSDDPPGTVRQGNLPDSKKTRGEGLKSLPRVVKTKSGERVVANDRPVNARSMMLDDDGEIVSDDTGTKWGTTGSSRPELSIKGSPRASKPLVSRLFEVSQRRYTLFARAKQVLSGQRVGGSVVNSAPGLKTGDILTDEYLTRLAGRVFQIGLEPGAGQLEVLRDEYRELTKLQADLRRRPFAASPEELPPYTRQYYESLPELKSGDQTTKKQFLTELAGMTASSRERLESDLARRNAQATLPVFYPAPPVLSGVKLHPVVAALRKFVRETVSKATHADRFKSVLAQLHADLLDIEEVLRDPKNMRGAAADARPQEWGIQDENAYDRNEGGQVFDKPDSRAALIAKKRQIEEDLRIAQQESVRGRARLYQRSMSFIEDSLNAEYARLLRLEIERIRKENPDLVDDSDGRPELTIEGLKKLGDLPEMLRKEIDPIIASMNVYRTAEAEAKIAESRELQEAHEQMFQDDLFQGARAAALLVDDLMRKKVRPDDAYRDAMRGLKEGAFKLEELLYAFRARKISVPQSIFSNRQHVSLTTKLRDHVNKSRYPAIAAQEWLTDMHRVMAMRPISTGQPRTSVDTTTYSEEERQAYEWWLGERNAARSGYLFQSITLEEARDPDTIMPPAKRALLRSMFDNMEEAWFQSVHAERVRSSRQFAAGIEPRLEAAYSDWLSGLKEKLEAEAKVAARSQAFRELRGMPYLAPKGDQEALTSVPQYDEYFEDVSPIEDVSPVSLANEADAALDRFTAEQGITRGDIERVEYQRSGRQGRGFNRMTFVLKDGRKLVGETLDLFPTEGQSQATETSIAIPELINEILRASDANPDPRQGDLLSMLPEVMTTLAKRGLDAAVARAEKLMLRDPRAQPRVRRETWSPDAGPQRDMFRQPTAGRPTSRPDEFEMLAVKLYTAEGVEIANLMNMAAEMNALRAAIHQEDTGQPVTDGKTLATMLELGLISTKQPETKTLDLDAVDELAASYVDHALDRVSDDIGFGMTVEDAATRDAQISEDSTDVDEIAAEDFEGFREQGDEDVRDQSPDEPSVSDDEYYDSFGGLSLRRVVGRPGVSMHGVAAFVERLKSTWANAGRVTVLPSPDHLPEPLKSRLLEKLAGGQAKGLYHDGQVYLFSNFLTSEADAEFTLFHESYGHLGMRAVLGDKFDQFLEMAYRTRPEVREAADAMMAGGLPKLEAIDEVLSDMAAENKNVSIVKQWTGKVIAGLREIGMSRVADWFASMTDAEVAYTLSAARDAVRNGTLPPISGAPGSIRLMDAKPPYEVFATKDGKTTGYARYNPITDSWAVFSADGASIKDGYTTTTTQDFDEVVRAMKLRGKVDYRLRSGLYVDDKIVADLVEMPKFNDTKKYSLWDPRRWAQIRRLAQLQFQNEYLPVFEVIEYLESKGRITPQTDVKTALMLYERRAGYLVEQFRKRYAEPIQKLVEQAGTLGVTKKDIDRYLTARHAFERNAVIASINPEMPDGGSGMTNEKARIILTAARSSPAGQVLEEIGRLTDMMGKEKVAYLQQTEMITKSLAEKLWQYDHYINLSGEAGAELDEDDPGLLAGGSKFNVKGKERRALGRGDGNEASDVLSRTLQAYEAALIRGQKNLVAQKVLALIETNYSPEFAIINAQPRKRQFNPETGEVEEVLDENYMARKDVMVAKVGGIPITIEFKERGLGSFADAIHGMVSPQQSGPIMAAIGKVSRFLGSLLTTYNPAFVLVNFTRDVQTVYMNAASDGRISKQMARDMVKALPTAIMAAIHEASGGRFGQGANSDTLRILREMQREGGITYFADRKSLEDQVKKLDDLLSGKKYPLQEVFQRIGGALEFLADVSEIAPRLAAYKVVRENGFSKEQAAVFSGDITVNFNMRGANKEVRQLYVFFNPAIQGSYKLYKLATTKDGQKQFAKIALGLTAFGFLTSMLGRALSGEDDDGIDKLDKVPVYKRATSVVLAADMPGGAPLPIPYGWNAFFATGVFMADTVLGKQPLRVTAGRIAKTTAEAFSPIGMGASDAKSVETFAAKFVAPTTLLPGVEFLANENRFGAPILKGQSQFDPAQLPDAQKYFRGVSPISKAVTDGLTGLTGGNKYNPGGIDVSPATIDFLIQSYLPGVPTDIYKGAGVAIRSAQGEEIKRAPWPIADRFSARIPSGYDAGAYRRAAELVETAYKEYENTRDQGRRQEIRAEYPRLGYAHAVIASTKQELRQVRQQIADLEERKMPQAQKIERKNRLLEREEVILKRATKKLMTAGDPVREAMMANE